MQAVADLMQIEIEVYPTAHATALGAAALARLAHNPSIGLTEAIVGWKPTLVLTPRWSAEQAADFRSRWNAAAETA
jgi:glycerol kinase